MKTCSSCKVSQSVDLFSKCTRNIDGLQYRCKDCSKKATIASKAKRVLVEPNHEKQVKQVWYQKNKELSKARAKKYRLDHPEWAKKMDSPEYKSEMSKTWRLRNPEKAKALASRQSKFRRFKLHGITIETYNELKAKQDSRCAICGVVPNDNYGGHHDGFHIDHDHVSGRVRGLLCKHCNVGIGMLKDSEEILQSAILYLRCHKTSDMPSVSQASVQ